MKVLDEEDMQTPETDYINETPAHYFGGHPPPLKSMVTKIAVSSYNIYDHGNRFQFFSVRKMGHQNPVLNLDRTWDATSHRKCCLNKTDFCKARITTAVTAS